MIGFIVAILVGIVCIVLGVKNTRGDISSLHSYHRNRVAKEDVLKFGKLVGSGTIIIGISSVLMGTFSICATTLNNEVYTLIGTGVLILGIIVGCILSFYAMIKYNKGIF